MESAWLTFVWVRRFQCFHSHMDENLTPTLVSSQCCQWMSREITDTASQTLSEIWCRGGRVVVRRSELAFRQSLACRSRVWAILNGRFSISEEKVNVIMYIVQLDRWIIEVEKHLETENSFQYESISPGQEMTYRFRLPTHVTHFHRLYYISYLLLLFTFSVHFACLSFLCLRIWWVINWKTILYIASTTYIVILTQFSCILNW